MGEPAGGGHCVSGFVGSLPDRARSSSHLLIRSVPIPRTTFFEDGITRRSAKLSQAAKPPLESRGALFECRATPYHRVDTGFNLRAPNSSPRAGISAGSALHLNLVSALRKARVSHPRLSCMIRGLSPIPRGGGKPEGKEGDCITTLGAVCPIEGVWVRTKIIRSVPNWLMRMKPGVQAAEYAP